MQCAPSYSLDMFICRTATIAMFINSNNCVPLLNDWRQQKRQVWLTLK